jgi:hypothetical protein
VIYWSKVIAWAATALCAIFSARAAAAFAKSTPRVFTILALFSLNWALLIPFYSSAVPSILLAGFAGFLLVYVGVLLRREFDNPLITEQAAQKPTADPANVKLESSQDGNRRDGVARGDRISLWLLGLLIAPSAGSLPFLPSSVVSINHLYTEPVISSLITYFGYYSVCSAMRIYSRRRYGWWLMSGVALPYAIVDGAFTYRLLTHPRAEALCASDIWRCPPTIMGPKFLFLFAILKIVFTALFVFLVLDESLSEEDRNSSVIDKVLKFFGL